MKFMLASMNWSNDKDAIHIFMIPDNVNIYLHLLALHFHCVPVLLMLLPLLYSHP